MSWSLAEARARRKEGGGVRPRTNKDLVEAWSDYSSSRLGEVTLQHYTYDIQVFLDYVGTHSVLDVDRDDIWAYVEDYLTSPRACKHFRAGGFDGPIPICRLGLDLGTCSLECPSREPVHLRTINKHLNSLASLYKFFTRRRWTETNHVKDVMQEWWEENRHALRPQVYRRITTGELERLIQFTKQPNRRIAWAILALTAIRAEELLRLRVDSRHLNLEEGWLVIPPRPHQKRRGETKLWLTSELRLALEEYLAWRKRKVKRDKDGDPVTEQLLITMHGDGWKTYSSLRRAWNEQCRRSGILDGTEDETTTLTLHDTRHWLTTELVKAKAPDYYVALYRGDKRGIISDAYTHLTEKEKRAQFLRYAPRLTV